jgi:hypothetical protein
MFTQIKLENVGVKSLYWNVEVDVLEDCIL